MKKIAESHKDCMPRRHLQQSPQLIVQNSNILMHINNVYKHLLLATNVIFIYFFFGIFLCILCVKHTLKTNQIYVPKLSNMCLNIFTILNLVHTIADPTQLEQRWHFMNTKIHFIIFYIATKTATTLFYA